jgi:hypothetical protein
MNSGCGTSGRSPPLPFVGTPASSDYGNGADGFGEIEMQKAETAFLKTMSEDEQSDWASDVLAEMVDDHAKALDIQGWKIVNIDDPDHRWPFNSVEAGCTAPDWCENFAGAAEVIPFPVQGRA